MSPRLGRGGGGFSLDPILGFRGLPGSAGACANRMRRQKETELVPLLPPPPPHTSVVLCCCGVPGCVSWEAGGTGGGRSRRECLRHRHVRRTTRSAPVPVGSRAPPTLLPSCLLCSYIIRLPTGNVTCAASTTKLSLPARPVLFSPVFCGVAARKEAASRPRDRMRGLAAAQHPSRPRDRMRGSAAAQHP